MGEQFDPFDVPLYPVAHQVTAQETTDPSEHITTLSLDGTPSEVLHWYREALLAQGWTFEEETRSYLSVYHRHHGRRDVYSLYIVVNPSMQASPELLSVMLRLYVHRRIC